MKIMGVLYGQTAYGNEICVDGCCVVGIRYCSNKPAFGNRDWQIGTEKA